MTTPLMNLTLPVPGVGGTPGPQWASEVNTNFEILDSHDHSSGMGAPVTPAGFNINADLVFNDFSASSLLSARFTSQVANPAGEPLVFVKNGELTYIDSLGQVVAITANGSVAGATGSIAGLTSPASAVFSSVTNSFTWSYDSGKTARMANADVILYPYDGLTAYVNTITLKAPTALAAAYSITLPLAVPTAPNVLSMDGSGVISAGAAPGSATNPSISFAADLDTGIYNSGTNTLAFANNGVRTGYFNTSGLNMISGTAALPSYTFDGDPNTGMYRSAADVLSFASNGVKIMSVFSVGLANLVGSASNPSYTFDGDTNTGMYQAGADTLGFTTAGTARFFITGNQLAAGSSGTNSAPVYTFNGDGDTGFYRVSASTIGVTCNSLAVASFSTIGLSVGSTSAADRVKWHVFTGSLAASANTTLSNPGTILLGVFGVCSTNGGSNYNRAIGDPVGVSTTGKIAFAGGSNPDIQITNEDSNSTNIYRVVMFYQ